MVTMADQTRRGPELATPGARQVIRDDDTEESTETLRSAVEIRTELVAIARECLETGTSPDPRRLEQLALELHYCAVSAVMLGRTRDAIAHENYAQATEETAELVRLLRIRREAAA